MPYVEDLSAEYDPAELGAGVEDAFLALGPGTADGSLHTSLVAAIDAAAVAGDVVRLDGRPLPRSVRAAFWRQFSLCRALSVGPGADEHCLVQGLMEALNAAEDAGVIKDIRKTVGNTEGDG